MRNKGMYCLKNIPYKHLLKLIFGGLCVYPAKGKASTVIQYHFFCLNGKNGSSVYQIAFVDPDKMKILQKLFHGAEGIAKSNFPVFTVDGKVLIQAFNIGDLIYIKTIESIIAAYCHIRIFYRIGNVLQ